MNVNYKIVEMESYISYLPKFYLKRNMSWREMTEEEKEKENKIRKYLRKDFESKLLVLDKILYHIPEETFKSKEITLEKLYNINMEKIEGLKKYKDPDKEKEKVALVHFERMCYANNKKLSKYRLTLNYNRVYYDLELSENGIKFKNGKTIDFNIKEILAKFSYDIVEQSYSFPNLKSKVEKILSDNDWFFTDNVNEIWIEEKEGDKRLKVNFYIPVVGYNTTDVAGIIEENLGWNYCVDYYDSYTLIITPDFY